MIVVEILLFGGLLLRFAPHIAYILFCLWALWMVFVLLARLAGFGARL